MRILLREKVSFIDKIERGTFWCKVLFLQLPWETNNKTHI